MKSHLSLALLLVGTSHAVLGTPIAFDRNTNVTYQGLERNGIEVFLNIPYGQDTGGSNRFKPPRPYVVPSGRTIIAQSYGPACPQPLGLPSYGITPVTEISEDCLNLNIGRPKGTCSTARLPVMVYIYGGGLWSGQNRDAVTAPDGLILESIQNGLPVIHVGINYRLGVFGFARSAALKAEGSENAGLRDQRLAIEWVRDNIDKFGGDPENVTIFGQSSGGLSAGLQTLAYGGSKPLPFQKIICESQAALEQGTTGTLTISAMQDVVSYIGCSTTSLDSEATVACLRCLDTETLFNASLATYKEDVAHNNGDIWLPAVDGDFLPALPSQLLNEGRFVGVTAMIGWCENDLAILTDATIASPNSTHSFISSFFVNLTSDNIDKLLSLYPSSDFQSDPSGFPSSEFYRAARILRDAVMTCPPMWFGEKLAKTGHEVYLYDWNQTILDKIVAAEAGLNGLGVIHGSDLTYVYGNLSTYDITGAPFAPTPSDYALQDRGSRSWSTFASTGKPGFEGHDTFRGFKPAFGGGNSTQIFVAGGPDEGLSAIDGPGANALISEQKLRERCAFLNSPGIIEQMGW